MGTEHTVLAMEAKPWHFIKGADNQTPQHKKETMFIQMLEGLHESEAKLLVAKDKRLHQVYKGLSQQVVKEAFDWTDDYKKDDKMFTTQTHAVQVGLWLITMPIY